MIMLQAAWLDLQQFHPHAMQQALLMRKNLQVSAQPNDGSDAMLEDQVRCLPCRNCWLVDTPGCCQFSLKFESGVHQIGLQGKADVARHSICEFL